MRVFVLFLFVTQAIFSQQYFTRTGTTEFKASVDTFEPVEAKNNSTTVVLDTNDGAIASLLLVKGFRFRVALMQEHFNENYMDSNEYPKATFKGKIHDFNVTELSSTKEYKISGTLTIKGKSKLISTKATLQKSGNMIILKSSFSVTPQDFNIKIPSIVRKKIAERIHISIHYELSQKK
ncbi:YceI family protein [Tenacibaculum tangerinum]|uniref:YceI family protein n=1 Tax=Tenacibaculum tangerinum TaxID=3038772 RepID=A0ABY8L2J6_9FLAO|nr:YceI family protein [Tenacibaculum tangerinum]WGH74325.1 YceI family protein [Tenacibaculum tangerinum]